MMLDFKSGHNRKEKAMSEVIRRLRRLDEAIENFFESSRWERWTNNLFRLSFMLFLVLALINADTIVAVWTGQPS